MARGKRERFNSLQNVEFNKYLHVMEMLIVFMSNKEGLYKDYSLQEFWNYIQEKRKELGGDNEEI